MGRRGRMARRRARPNGTAKTRPSGTEARPNGTETQPRSAERGEREREKEEEVEINQTENEWVPKLRLVEQAYLRPAGR